MGPTSTLARCHSLDAGEEQVEAEVGVRAHALAQGYRGLYEPTPRGKRIALQDRASSVHFALCLFSDVRIFRI